MFQEFFFKQSTGIHDAVEIFQLHQMAQEFRCEVEERERFDAYCEWYYATAARHQQELAQMRKEFDLRGWISGVIRN